MNLESKRESEKRRDVYVYAWLRGYAIYQTNYMVFMDGDWGTIKGSGRNTK